MDSTGAKKTPYESLQSLLSTNVCTYKFVFVKGLQKKLVFIKRIINLEDYGCPKLKDLLYVQRKTCLRHCDSALHDWMLNYF